MANRYKHASLLDPQLQMFYCLSKPQMMSPPIALDYIADESAQFDETFICVI